MTKIIISGGGTGGHIFPAIAIANALKAKVKEADILFIGAKGRMEMEKVPAAGYRIVGLTVSGFQRRMTWKNLTFPFKLLVSMMKARAVIRSFKPDVVIGVGGYASGPTLRIATNMGIPCLIQEQNSYPGVTNRLLGNKVRKICVAYAGMEKYFPKEKLILTGNPIRQDLVNLTGKGKGAQEFFGLREGVQVVLVIGGSLGAGTINQAVLEFVRSCSEGATDELKIQILWQTGKYYYKSVLAQLQEAGYRSRIMDDRERITDHGSWMREMGPGIPLIVQPFIDRMDLAYAVADLIISRAGAIAISELCVVAKPVILIPSPNVAEDHQTKNAKALAERDAALLIRDHEAIEKLGIKIAEVIQNQTLQANLKKNIALLGISNAAEKIADESLKLIPENPRISPEHENRHLVPDPDNPTVKEDHD
ncbi:MAG: undecaprenyldiphospho-muramoylpentapeptide beta-N-acetylglucosaminyltransferase [Bacteroidales bacterium]|nr:undecaprenyldiphospho-muramoylpentapeptide beta-N-acetylglucosaminyltransferase [Bacteroidales bacterium]